MLDSSQKTKPLADTPGGSFLTVANSGSSRPAHYILHARVALAEVEGEGGTTGPGLQTIQRLQTIQTDCGLIASRPNDAAWSVASRSCGGELDAIRDNKDLEWR
jgi:hypothetical protein